MTSNPEAERGPAELERADPGRSGPERGAGIGQRLRVAAARLLSFMRDDEPIGLLDEPLSLREVAAEAGVADDEVVVVEEWVEADGGEAEPEPGWHGNPVIGWFRTDAAEGKDPNVGPTPRPGGPRPGAPRPGGPRPGVRPSGPPSE